MKLNLPKFEETHPLYGASLGKILFLLAINYFKICLFVIGGGYAIIAAANDVFAKRLKWLRDGELIDMLPVLQMIPGLIAGNSAIYVGRKVAGWLGALVALVSSALPSLIVLSLIAHFYNYFEEYILQNVFVQGAFHGLRCALTALILTTLLSSWKRIMRGFYAYSIFAITLVASIVFHVQTWIILVAPMLLGMLIGAYKAIADKQSKKGDVAQC